MNTIGFDMCAFSARGLMSSWSCHAFLFLYLILAPVVVNSANAQVRSDTALYNEPYRPQFHFSPEQNWTNDPNGLVYADGWYHLFYQYNPNGDEWGHMSWGHAQSRDLMHWHQRPVAIPETDTYMAFSGSAVFDENNTSELGTTENPPLVAIYTAHRKSNGLQVQHLAYSTDQGTTWSQYADNPVLNIDSDSFRDPKVFWHDSSGQWIMAITLSGRKQVQFYGSPNLKSWELLSTFGPKAATGGLWEVPDLVKLPVVNQPGTTKWLLQVDINRGALQGGSGGQYFVGSFDGQNFLWEQGGYDTRIHQATLFEDFESDDYGDWTASGEAFGPNPARGTLSNQMTVSNYLGVQLVNSFYNGDGTTGTLKSPDFEIQQDYINFLIGGGDHPGETGIQLIVEGDTVRSSTGHDSEALQWEFWNVNQYRGDSARIEIYDYHTGGWGHINIDHIVFDNEAAIYDKGETKWVDYGKDFYAFQSWSNIPESDGRVIGLAWMNNWLYARDIPTSPWRGSMTIPRTWKLVKKSHNDYRLVQTPVAEIKKLRKDTVKIVDKTIQGPSNLLMDRGVEGRTLDINLSLEINTASEAGIILRRSDQDSTIVGYDKTSEELFINRFHSGEVEFNSRFPGTHAAPLTLSDDSLNMRILLDRSSLEVFAGEGERVLTDRIFPGTHATGLRLYSKGGSAWLDTITVWHLESVWDSTFTGIKGSYLDPDRPSNIKLKSNYPNPFNPSTQIKFNLPRSANVTLTVFNSLGQKVSTLVNRDMNAGRHSINFDGGDLPSGLYIYRLKANGMSKSRKMLLVK